MTMPVSPVVGPSKIHLINGTVPGVLDPSQPARLLRLSNSTLSFAAFDPLTATAATDTPNIHRLSFQERSFRPKRVVVETAPTGECFWRFVPKARLKEGVHDEGTWPRIVDICGTLYVCSQDQWDLYKLDTAYDCVVNLPPNLSTISKVDLKPAEPPQTPPVSRGKRSILTPSPEPDETLGKKRKLQRMESSILRDSESEMEVEEIIADERLPRGDRSKKAREQFEKNRKIRREKINARFQRTEAQDEIMHEPQFGSSPPRGGFAAGAIKRKGSSLSGDPANQESPQCDTNTGSRRTVQSHSHKRARTVSPESVRRELEGKRTERRQQKAGKWSQWLDEKRYMREKMFMDEILKDVPEQESEDFEEPDDSGTAGQSHEPESQDSQMDEETAREARIAESRRKLAELEGDRPLWEEAARKRALREKAEEEARRAMVEDQRRAAALQAEAEQRARAEKEAEDLRQREETLRRDRKDFLRRERARRQQQRQRGYALGPWTTHRALEQYKMLSEIFDNTKFSQDDPLTIEDVPWPVLHSPVSFTVEDVDWSSVERFFEAAKFHMQWTDFKVFVQASHRRFHPDRWRARGLLKSIQDDIERECLEVAATSVSQALTPLWTDLKEQS